MLPKYLHALETEILSRCELWVAAGIPGLGDMAADTIYLGGGTPGLLSGEQLENLLRAVRTSFCVDAHSEITLEASPENVTPESAAAWAACGVNRLSLGVQSFAQKELRAVGRRHDAGTVAAAVRNLRAAGIENISIARIAGLRHQTPESWKQTLESTLALEPTHLSVYMLEVDEDSRLGKEILAQGSRYGAAAAPSEEQVAELYLAAMERLRQAGFHHYEVSNFARPGQESRHNEKYWTGVPYFGFGVEAHSYDGARRWANTDSLTEYLQLREQGRSPITTHRALGAQEQLEERFFLGLRRRAGIQPARLAAEFQRDVSQIYARQIREFSEAGWLETAGDWLRLTDQGLLFSNEVFAGFLG